MGKDLAGLAGLILVLNAALGILAHLLNFGGGTVTVVRVAGLGVSVLLLAAAGIVHTLERAKQDARA